MHGFVLSDTIFLRDLEKHPCVLTMRSSRLTVQPVLFEIYDENENCIIVTP